MREQTRALLAKAQENIDASEVLIEKGFHGIAIGRAYYAMFYAAEAVLLEQGLEFSSHGEVQGAFGRELVKTGKLPATLHRDLLRAFRDRQAADYDAPTRTTLDDAVPQLDNAKAFVAAVSDFVRHGER